MNDNVRVLIQAVCDGDIRKAQAQTRRILSESTTKKDEQFVKSMLRTLDAKQSRLIELPCNLRELLIAEDVSNFPVNRFILRSEESCVVEKALATFRAANALSEMGITYASTLMLYGKSGGGKTMLARYIAYQAGLPFVYVKFSSLVSSHLGSTQSNIAKVFEYSRTISCVLCFDEIDAVGMARGQKNDVGEMNRVVIALMQEMDSLPNNVIIIGTTNRMDRLDEALLRRFCIYHEVLPLEKDDIRELARKFFAHAGYETAGWLEHWCAEQFGGVEQASTVVSKCTDKVVSDVIFKQQKEDGGNDE